MSVEIDPQHVVIRNQAAQCCYSTTNVLNTTTPGATAASFSVQATFATGSNPVSVTTVDVNGGWYMG